MKQYIVLLRGINVGGSKKIPMANLRKVLDEGGFNDVQTYIQSGNVVLNSSLATNEKVESKISKLIQKEFGFEVEVLTKTRHELEGIFNDCPFPQSKKEKSYFMLLFEQPKEALVQDVIKESYSKEEFVITKNCVYFYSDVGYGNSKFNNNFFERKLKVSATARNYNTMVKLLSLST